MSLYKQAKDQIARLLLGANSVPSGLVELNKYFRFNGPIKFRTEKQEDGSIIAVSDGFLFGSIVTHAKDSEQLNEKIADAILTAFDIPSSYVKEANIHRVGEKEYAFA